MPRAGGCAHRGFHQGARAALPELQVVSRRRASGAPTLRWLRAAAKRWSHPASLSEQIMWNRWGPAHELGHALIAGQDDSRYHFAYGLCDIETRSEERRVG